MQDRRDGRQEEGKIEGGRKEGRQERREAGQQ